MVGVLLYSPPSVVLYAPKVVANAITALANIHTSLPSTSSSDPAIFTITPAILNKLLIALNECSEWGRVAILSALARYEAQYEKENGHICERVVPQFQHVNGSVVLGAVKVCAFAFLGEYVRDIAAGHYDPHAQRDA
jgi:AP-1 complex subunit beta-1